MYMRLMLSAAINVNMVSANVDLIMKTGYFYYLGKINSI